MAKGGSLLGKADTTLTGMSYKQAMADVTPDLKDVYKKSVFANSILFCNQSCPVITFSI